MVVRSSSLNSALTMKRHKFNLRPLRTNSTIIKLINTPISPNSLSSIPRMAILTCLWLSLVLKDRIPCNCT